MRARYLTVLALALGFLAPRCFGCSCSNDTPIQKSYSRYTSPQRAVFTARVVGFLGKAYKFQGRRAASRALAIVHEKYWGMPWYWPKIVLLDGSYPCDIAMLEGEEYLVQGWKSRYGVVSVSGCSRTQPLRTAQIDRRTLDGSHCLTPGGTMIGHVSAQPPIRSAAAVAVRDLKGNTYRSSVDKDGIFELRHLPSGELYAPDSRVDGRRYLSSSYWANSSIPLRSLHEGRCEERNLFTREYQLTGRLLPGIARSVRVELASVKPGVELRASSIEPDGRFYFEQVPAGEYILSVQSTIGDTNPRVFYPGVGNAAKATRIAMYGSANQRTYDFDARALPVVPIHLVLDSVAGSERFLWDFQLLEGDRVISTSRAEGTSHGLIYGMRGGAYRVQLYGYAHEPQKDDDCTSDAVPLTAGTTIDPVHIIARCRPVTR